MNKQAGAIILLVLALIMLALAGVLFGMGLNLRKGEADSDNLVASIGVENQYRECSEHFSPFCYNWQYIKGTFAADTLTVGDESVSLTGQYNEELMLTELQSKINIRYLRNISSTPGVTAYVAVNPADFTAGLAAGNCVEGVYYNFSRLSDTLNTDRFFADNGHSGILELAPCAAANSEIDPLFKPDRFTQVVLDR